jgi:hypothetical protein
MRCSSLVAASSHGYEDQMEPGLVDMMNGGQAGNAEDAEDAEGQYPGRKDNPRIATGGAGRGSRSRRLSRRRADDGTCARCVAETTTTTTTRLLSWRMQRANENGNGDGGVRGENEVAKSGEASSGASCPPAPRRRPPGVDGSITRQVGSVGGWRNSKTA